MRKHQLEILNAIDHICKKHTINYVLFAGTLLGAIRHRGFIPWDDDVDIAMPRSDYERFMKVCDESLPDRFFLQTFRTDPPYFNQYARIRRNNTTYLQKRYAAFDMHHGIFVDIFPFDHAFPYNKFLKYYQICTISFSRFVAKFVNYAANKQFVRSHPSPLKRFLYTIARPLVRILSTDRVNLWYERTITKLNTRPSPYCTHLTWRITSAYYRNYLIRNQDFLETTLVEFEGASFPAPKTHHEWLTRIYGDYMRPPPKDKQIAHHDVILIKLE